MYIKIQVKDADLRRLLAAMLVSNRRLLDRYKCESCDWHRAFLRGMGKGKIIAVEGVQFERDNERGKREG